LANCQFIFISRKAFAVNFSSLLYFQTIVQNVGMFLPN
jgi:hypothetical protein